MRSVFISVAIAGLAGVAGAADPLANTDVQTFLRGSDVATVPNTAPTIPGITKAAGRDFKDARRVVPITKSIDYQGKPPSTEPVPVQIPVLPLSRLQLK